VRFLQGLLSLQDLFKEPDSKLPLKCDMCESDPPEEKPLCVQWCITDALSYEEREEEVEEEEKQEDIDVAFESLVDKYGMEKVMDTMAERPKRTNQPWKPSPLKKSSTR